MNFDSYRKTCLKRLVSLKDAEDGDEKIFN